MRQVFGCKNRPNKIGVIIAQLGTPEAPTASALRPYLKQFLSDRRVIEIPRILWWFILNVIILNTRPKRSAKLYARIWTDRGSPLLKTTLLQAEKTKELLAKEGLDFEFVVGMRYGAPDLGEATKDLIKRGCTKIILFPMYPQYSASTTASTYDAVFATLLKERFVPTLKVVDPFYQHKGYIEALIAQANEYLENAKHQPDKIILSYHGVPLSYVQKGDPYCCQCVETTQLFIENSKIPTDKIQHCFQSRFGKDPWLNPYTDETVEKFARDGLKHLAVMCPGFTADCLETLDEIANEARESFHKLGGETLNLIPCVNDHPIFIRMMADIIKDEAATWLSGNNQKMSQITCPAVGL